VANVSSTPRRSASGQARHQELQYREAAEEVTVMFALIAALERWWNNRQAKRRAAGNR
jgi:class 3 adenylate cyclase